jgi:hypothetical protein
VEFAGLHSTVFIGFICARQRQLSASRPKLYFRACVAMREREGKGERIQSLVLQDHAAAFSHNHHPSREINNKYNIKIFKKSVTMVH